MMKIKTHHTKSNQKETGKAVGIVNKEKVDRRLRGRGWPPSWSAPSEHDFYFRDGDDRRYDPEELQALWYYEFAREAERANMVGVITDSDGTVMKEYSFWENLQSWRGKDFDPEKIKSDQLYNKEFDRLYRKRDFFEEPNSPGYPISVDDTRMPFVAAWPEWPTKPYLSVEKSERKRRLSFLPCRIVSSSWSEIANDCYSLSAELRSKLKSKQSEKTGIHQGIFVVDWRASNSAIMCPIDQWLIANPQKTFPEKMSQRGHQGRQNGIKAEIITRDQNFIWNICKYQKKCERNHIELYQFTIDRSKTDIGIKRSFTQWLIENRPKNYPNSRSPRGREGVKGMEVDLAALIDIRLRDLTKNTKIRVSERRKAEHIIEAYIRLMHPGINWWTYDKWRMKRARKRMETGRAKVAELLEFDWVNRLLMSFKGVDHDGEISWEEICCTPYKGTEKNEKMGRAVKTNDDADSKAFFDELDRLDADLKPIKGKDRRLVKIRSK
jgi:hypothetical protein